MLSERRPWSSLWRPQPYVLRVHWLVCWWIFPTFITPGSMLKRAWEARVNSSRRMQPIRLTADLTAIISRSGAMVWTKPGRCSCLIPRAEHRFRWLPTLRRWRLPTRISCRFISSWGSIGANSRAQVGQSMWALSCWCFSSWACLSWKVPRNGRYWQPRYWAFCFRGGVISCRLPTSSLTTYRCTASSERWHLYLLLPSLPYRCSPWWRWRRL